jgi:hypothetical protein
MLRQKPGSQFRHRNIAFSLDPVDKNTNVRR